MERLDFASITQILRSEASEGRFLSQMEFADALLFDTGKQQKAIQAIEKIRMNLEALPEDMSSGLAMLTEALDTMYFDVGELENAREYLCLSQRLYAALWADEPDRIEAKAEEMKVYLGRVNLQSISS